MILAEASSTLNYGGYFIAGIFGFIGGLLGFWTAFWKIKVDSRIAMQKLAFDIAVKTYEDNKNQTKELRDIVKSPVPLEHTPFQIHYLNVFYLVHKLEEVKKVDIDTLVAIHRGYLDSLFPIVKDYYEHKTKTS
jgi:hypothetical protein